MDATNIKLIWLALLCHPNYGCTSWINPTFSWSKQPKAFLIVSSGSVPWNKLNCSWRKRCRRANLKSLSKEGEEHGEVDWAWCLAHHRIQVFVCWVLKQVRSCHGVSVLTQINVLHIFLYLAQRCKHVMKILIVYESIPVVEKGHIWSNFSQKKAC